MVCCNAVILSSSSAREMLACHDDSNDGEYRFRSRIVSHAIDALPSVVQLTRASTLPVSHLSLSLLDGHLIVLQGIRNPFKREVGPGLLARAEYFACCSYGFYSRIYIKQYKQLH